MGLTLAAKILAQSCGREAVVAGERVRVQPRVVTLDEDALSRIVARGFEREACAGRVVVFEDGFRADGTAGWRALDAAARAFARASGATLVPAGRGGAQLVELADRGLVAPGDLVVSGARGASALGVLGAVVLEAGDDALASLLRDPTLEIEIPRTLRLTLTGKPGRWCSGRDLGEQAAAALQAEIAGATVAIDGAPYAELELPERLALADALVAAGARGVTCVPDERALAWVRARCARLVRPVLADADAEFHAARTLDVDGAGPTARCVAGELAGAAKAVANLPTWPLSGVVLGGEHGGRIDDLRLAARLLKEHPVGEDVTLIVVPGSQRALQHAAEEGLLTVLVRSGVVLATPSSGLFGGPRGFATAPGDRWLFTSRPHGLPHGVDALVASAAVAIASAVLGRVAHPDEVLRRQRETV